MVRRQGSKVHPPNAQALSPPTRRPDRQLAPRFQQIYLGLLGVLILALMYRKRHVNQCVTIIYMIKKDG
jgi:hypothetical protein